MPDPDPTLGKSSSNPRPRPAARVILVDDQTRVLLFRVQLEREPENVFWITPGGGLNSEETWEAGAKRELWEEIGLDTFELGPCAWEREHVFYWQPEDTWYRQQERYFLARIPAHEVVTMHQEENEAQYMTSHRWWSLDELRESEDRLVPENFAELFERLLADGAPDSPLVVGL